MISAVGTWGDAAGSLRLKEGDKNRWISERGKGDEPGAQTERLALKRRRDTCFSEEVSPGVFWVCLEREKH